jgi:hypothetical protein
MKLLLAIFATLFVASCSSSEEATRVLQEQGYRNIQTTGYDWFGCSEKDNFHTGFEATSPGGFPVTGVVCSGFLKGNTIRLY